jgi:hypothetical protein
LISCVSSSVKVYLFISHHHLHDTTSADKLSIALKGY